MKDDPQPAGRRQATVLESVEEVREQIRRARTAKEVAAPAAEAPKPAAVPPKLAQPRASEGGNRPAVATGSLSVDSRPMAAAVTINGKPSGNTPVTINDLAPGEYRVVMVMAGYRNFATTVRVVAGERARAAASLTAQE